MNSRNVDAYSFQGALDFVNKLSRTYKMRIMKVKIICLDWRKRVMDWPFFQE